MSKATNTDAALQVDRHATGVRTGSLAQPNQEAAGAGGDEMARVLDEHRAALLHHFPVPPARPAASRRRRALRKAGGVLAIVLLAAGTWWLDPVYRSEQFATLVGQRAEIGLADGSQLTLDTNTRLTVKWRLRSRQVLLEEGRARFDVSPSAWRPFTVAADAVRVRVVGTRFDVWQRPMSTEVTVYQGRVAVWHDGQEAPQVLLQPGQQVSVPTGMMDSSATLHVQSFDESRQAAWRQGRLVFQETPLGQVLEEIQRYTALSIRVEDAETAGLVLSGVFDSGNIEQLLGLLPSILPVRVQRQAGSVSIISIH